MKSRRPCHRHLFLLTLLFLFLTRSAESVPYDIVYVRSPRPDDTTRIDIPEVKDPIRVPPDTDLMLLHPDGSEELLVPGGDGAIVDPYISFDALWVYYGGCGRSGPTAAPGSR